MNFIRKNLTYLIKINNIFLSKLSSTSLLKPKINYKVVKFDKETNYSSAGYSEIMIEFTLRLRKLLSKIEKVFKNIAKN